MNGIRRQTRKHVLIVYDISIPFLLTIVFEFWATKLRGFCIWSSQINEIYDVSFCIDTIVSHTIPSIKDEYRTSRAAFHPIESALNRIFCIYNFNTLIY